MPVQRRKLGETSTLTEYYISLDTHIQILAWAVEAGYQI